MGIGLIILVGIMILTIMAMIALLTKDRQDHSHQADHRVLLPGPLLGTTNPRKSGLWYTTNWFAGEKVNEAIREGKERYAHQRGSHHAQRQPKRSRGR